MMNMEGPGTGAFESLIDAFPDAVFLHDAEGVILRANRRVSENLGYDRDRIVGRSIWTLAPDPDPAAVKARWQAMTPGTTERFTGRRERHDGSTFPVEVHVTKLDVDGQARFLATVRDVTDQRERERELERKNEQLEEYRTMVQTVGDGVYMLDTEQRFTFVNEAMCNITGYEADALLGRHVSLLIGEEAAATSRSVREALDENDGPAMMEGEHERADGETFYGEVQFAPLYTQAGEFRGTVGVLRDVTERKSRERELERQNERLEDFARTLSHDLRNPLTVAKGHFDLARESGSAEHFETVEQALDRMDRLIEDLFTLARDGQAVEDPEPLELSDLATRCWQNVETGDATIEVDSELCLLAEESRLQQVFENLYRNAIEHGRSEVTIRVGALTEEAGFYVADDGPGIPPAEHDRVFEAGYSTHEHGTGFGLTIVEEIAEAHGWEVAVRSGATGGARFEFVGVETRCPCPG